MNDINPALYKWSRSPSDTQTFQRRALSSENLWLHRPSCDRALYVFGSLRLDDAKGFDELQYRTTLSWRRFRFLHPEIGLRGSPKEKLLKYTIPADDDDVFGWAEQTSTCEAEYPRIKQENNPAAMIDTVERIWSSLSESPAADLDQMAYLCLFTEKPRGPDELVERMQFLMRFDHLCADGIGAQILAGEFLKIFAEKPDMAWRPTWSASIKNLMPSWIEIMNTEQRMDGPEFEDAVQKQRVLMLEHMARNPVLPFSVPKANRALPLLGLYRQTISKAESMLLLESIRNLPQGTTITHLTHAAMVLTLLRCNAQSTSTPAARAQPSSDKIDVLHSPCFLSARRCIRPTATCLDPTTSYIPICQALGDITFTDLSSYDLPENSPPTTVLETLLRACNAAKDCYLAIKERKSILSESLPLMHELGNQMGESKTSTQQSSSSTSKESKLAGAEPFLLSDGITNKYIKQSYGGTAGTSTGMRFKVLTASFAAAPSSDNLIIRLSSWNDEITVAAEWKSDLYEESTVKSFVADIVKLLLLFGGGAKS